MKMARNGNIISEENQLMVISGESWRNGVAAWHQ
jgi:hypothetical protein